MLSRRLLIDRSLDVLARLCLRHSKQIAIISFLAALLAFAGASRLRFDPDLLNLIPQNNRQVNEFRKVLRDMGTIDYHIVVLQMPPGRDPREYDRLIASIADGYSKSERIEDVTYRLPNPLDFVDVILPRALLFLTPAELNQIAARLTDDGIREAVARNRTLLQTPQSVALKQLIQYDPFNLAPVFLAKLQGAGGGFQFDASSGYYLSGDRSTLIILAKPKRPAQDVPFGQALLEEGAVIETRALVDFQKSAPSGTPLPKIEHTGGYHIAVADTNLIRQDAIVNVVGSFVGVLALFLYGFRRVASLGYASAPLALGLVLTFGVAGVTYGELSQISACAAALLAGLGIDFITVLYGRYVDERNRGETMAHALRTTLRTTLPGVAIAAVTTAATFYAFLATDFRGMTQLGFLTGTGILLFLLCVMFLLPALLVISERKIGRRPPKLYLHSFGSEPLVRFSVERPRPTILIWTIFIVATALLSLRVRFSDNIQDLRAKSNIGVVNQARLTEKFGQSFDFMMYVAEGKTADEALARTHAASREFDVLVADRTIGSYQSIATFLPPRDQQLQIIAALERGRSVQFNIGRIRTVFRQALIDNGFRPEAYDQYLELFSRALAPTEPVSVENLGNNDLLKLLGRYMKRVDDGWMSVTFLYPTGKRWPRDVPPRLTAVADRHPGDILTGVNQVSSTLRTIVKADATRATVIGLAAVAVLMFLSFRSLTMTALSFVPFIAGASAMGGFMAIFNLEFNFMNVFVGLMIIGCATDYAVYMMQRYLESPATFQTTAQETAKAVAMAAVTTIVGYGSFALSHYPGLRSIGYASTFGILFGGLAAITLVPAILMVKNEHIAKNDSVSHQ